MGWPPTNRGSATAEATGYLTLPTSVTIPAPASSRLLAVSARTAGGVATTARSQGPRLGDAVDRADINGGAGPLDVGL